MLKSSFENSRHVHPEKQPFSLETFGGAGNLRHQKENSSWGIFKKYLEITQMFNKCFHGTCISSLPSRCLDVSEVVHHAPDTVGGSEIPNNHLGCIKPVVNHGINYQPQLVSRISEPSTQQLATKSPPIISLGAK